LPVDREYACIFPLATPRDCSKPNDPLDSYACDCQATGLKGDQVPPLCGLNTTTNDYQTQYYAKAYPTIRELTLANLLGSQGIISSLCPIHVTDNAAGDDPVYGYRPAVTAIINRLKKALASQCLPQPLQTTSTPTGLQAPCLVLATLPETKAGTEDTVCKGYPGLTTVSDASVLATFRADQHAQWLTAMTGTDPSTLATCEVNQISVSPGTNGNSGSCVGAGSTGEAGWCYVTGTAAGSCDTQAILFTSGTPPNGATVNLQCILENAGDSGTGGGG
jgi:hypothetical protein